MLLLGILGVIIVGVFLLGVIIFGSVIGWGVIQGTIEPMLEKGKYKQATAVGFILVFIGAIMLFIL